jgi:hypothetical protein
MNEQPYRWIAAMLAAAVFLSGPAKAQQGHTHEEPPAPSRDSIASAEELAKYCETAPCKRNVTVRLLRKDGTVYEQHSDLLPPAIQGGLAVIHPGETLRMSPVFDGDEFTGWRPAPDDAPVDLQVVTVHLQQNEGEVGMMATISTNTGPGLKLTVGMFLLDGPEHPVKTSTCPLMPGPFSVYETWPHPIYSLLIGKARRLRKDEQVACE